MIELETMSQPERESGNTQKQKQTHAYKLRDKIYLACIFLHSFSFIASFVQLNARPAARWWHVRAAPLEHVTRRPSATLGAGARARGRH